MGMDHTGPLGFQYHVQLGESALWLKIRFSLSKNLMVLACITDSPTSLNIGLRGFQPSNSVFHLTSSCSSSHMILQLKSHLSIFIYDVKLNAHMCHIYGWWIDFFHNWHDLHCSKRCLSSIIAVFFNEIHVEFYHKKIR